MLENELKNLKNYFDSSLSKEPVFTEKDRQNIRRRINKYHHKNYWIPKTLTVALLCAFFFIIGGFVMEQLGLKGTLHHQGAATAEKPSVIFKEKEAKPPVIENGAQMKMSKQADLFHSGEEETVGLVNLPEVQGQVAKGYVGIWNNNGELMQKVAVEGYNIMFPVQIYTQDITRDGFPDIVLETDEHANGGNGVHDVNVFVQKEKTFVETPLPEDGSLQLTARFDPSIKSFLVQANNHRSWNVTLDSSILGSVHPKLLKQTNPVNMDPISAITIENGTLVTKRLLWFGNLQLNSLGLLVSSYDYQNGKWGVKGYDIVSGNMAQVSENK